MAAGGGNSRLHRNPRAEDDINLQTLLTLGPVQERNVSFQTTSILVSGRLLSLC